MHRSALHTPEFDIVSGWLRPARHAPSPNFGPRPTGCEPDLLVIHNISLPPGEYGGPCIEQLFTNCLDWDSHPYFNEIRGTEVSSHLLIRRDGEVVQFVDLRERAWHAGISSYQGRSDCNDFSIGIELEGTDEDAYTGVQYEILVAVSRALFRYFPVMNTSRIAGHSDIAPGRKTDPGASFNWDRYHKLLSEAEE